MLYGNWDLFSLSMVLYGYWDLFSLSTECCMVIGTCLV